MIFLIFFLAVGTVAGQMSISKTMYDNMARLVGEEEYPATWWQERQECLALISPSLTNRLELAWLGLIQYWEAGGAETDPWQTCDQQARWFEKNCTVQPGIEMAIWEPCNYVSNLAYDRLVVELCTQTDWVMELTTLNSIRQSFAILTFASSFMHGSETHLGARQDVMSNDLLAFIIHQTLLRSVPYNPILHDLSLSPRNMKAEEIVEYWLEMYETKDVMEWYDHMEIIDMPRIQMSFAGAFGHIMLLVWGLNQTVTIATPLMSLLGVKEEEQTFLMETYLPLLEEITDRYPLTTLEKAELLENTLGTVMKLLFAFLWQEDTIDLNGLNESPEANEAGAAFLPRFNMFANNLTLWDLNVQDVQLGGGYPGSVGCNNVIPHAKWHLQTAASLSDMARLVDFILYLELAAADRQTAE